MRRLAAYLQVGKLKDAAGERRGDEQHMHMVMWLVDMTGRQPRNLMGRQPQLFKRRLDKLMPGFHVETAAVRRRDRHMDERLFMPRPRQTTDMAQCRRQVPPWNGAAD